MRRFVVRTAWLPRNKALHSSDVRCKPLRVVMSSLYPLGYEKGLTGHGKSYEHRKAR